jgi:CrcB protein
LVAKIVLLLAGGAVGTLCRYGVTVWLSRIVPSFPLGVLAVNVTGSFLIGLCWCLGEAFHFSVQARAFLFTGLFGGFTTFSSFSLDTMELFRAGDYKMAIVNILLNNTTGLIAVFAGFFLGKQILTFLK